ncbi:hypothetical protein niasHS_002868 [Heterodera schachtii]|uniref:RRM domain-containing protein n=1 Tax=Heterodera schachtii TaxID=97005 RepID=A0ABD2K2Q9_HETSC
MNLNSSEKLDSEGTMAVLNAISDGTIAASNAISDGIMAASNGTSTQSFEAENSFGKTFCRHWCHKRRHKSLASDWAKLRSSQLDDLHRAEQYAMDQSIKYVMQKQQASANCNTNHKGFCFYRVRAARGGIQFRAADTMNGRMFGGRNIKVVAAVGRQDTMPQAQADHRLWGDERGPPQYNRVYVSSVGTPPDISEQDVAPHRGFGFLEFKTANSVKEAVEGMNGFDLGGQFLQGWGSRVWRHPDVN